VARRAARRGTILARLGWPIEIIADPTSPVRLTGFDPMNSERLSASEVLHTRYLALKNESATVDVFDGQALTSGTGTHPLFEGVVRVQLTGLASPPSVRRERDTITIEATGLTVTATNSRLAEDGEKMTLYLAG
jgi:hypothetical protein